MKVGFWEERRGDISLGYAPQESYATMVNDGCAALYWSFDCDGKVFTRQTILFDYFAY